MFKKSLGGNNIMLGKTQVGVVDADQFEHIEFGQRTYS